MTIYCVQTLVDITENGPLNRTFPFKGKSGNLIHDKSSLHIAKNQEQNFELSESDKSEIYDILQKDSN